jgi:hypothetical protein
MCVGAVGLISRKQYTNSSSKTGMDGIDFYTISEEEKKEEKKNSKNWRVPRGRGGGEGGKMHISLVDICKVEQAVSYAHPKFYRTRLE